MAQRAGGWLHEIVAALAALQAFGLVAASAQRRTRHALGRALAARAPPPVLL